jgi:Rrf2 family iron-sulfur cluster assembly transcriptional regulator
VRLTRATNYAVRALVAMGERGTLARSDLPTLARDMGAPSAFLGKVLQRLARSGLVRSARGAAGGYSLARRPEQITVREVVEVFEGATSLAACSSREERCPRAQACRTRRLWSRLQKRLNAALESETIGGLVAVSAPRRRKRS